MHSYLSRRYRREQLYHPISFEIHGRQGQIKQGQIKLVVGREMPVVVGAWLLLDSPTERIITLCITSERIPSERINTERITSERINLNVCINTERITSERIKIPNV